MSKSLMESHSEDKEFEFVVSFADEDRKYAESIVFPLKERGYHVFYDNDFFADMWGHDLAEYFTDTRENKSRFALMFISGIMHVRHGRSMNAARYSSEP